MNRLKFNTSNLTIAENNSLPLTASHLNEWLESLVFKTNYQSCSALCSAVAALKHAELEAKVRFELLIVLLAFLENLTEQLNHEFLDSGFPLSKDEKTHVEMFVWLFFELSKQFIKIALQPSDSETSRLSIKERVQAMYLSLSTAREAQFYCSELYALVEEGFWIRCYQAFHKAQKHNFLDEEINIKGIQSGTINSIFKQILLLECIETDRFGGRELKVISDIIAVVAHHALIVDAKSVSSSHLLFHFNSKKDSPPRKIHFDAQTVNDHHYFFDPLPAVQKISGLSEKHSLSHNTFSYLNSSLLAKVNHNLTQFKKRKFSRYSSQTNLSVFVGLKNIIKILQPAISEQAPSNEAIDPNYDPKIAGGWKALNADLVAIGDELNYQVQHKPKSALRLDPKLRKLIQAAGPGSERERIWQASALTNSEKPLPEAGIEIQNSGLKGYSLIWKSADTRIKIGEILAIQRSNEPGIELGVIVRMEQLADASLRLGVELLGIEFELVGISWENRDETKAILKPCFSSQQQADTIIVETGLMRENHPISLTRNGQKQNFQLGKLVFSSSAIQQFELWPQPLNK